MKHYLLPIFTLVLLATTFSCEKEEPNDPEPSEPTMPPLTHQGLNTFGCYIDGELFVASEGPSVWSIPPVSGSFDENSNRLLIQGTRYNMESLSEAVTFPVIVDDNEGSYEMDINFDHVRGYDPVDNCIFYHDSLNKGFCSIEFIDKAKNIIAGTFYMTLTNKYCETDTIMEITDGRFDFRY